MVLYTSHPDPQPGHFDGAILGAEIVFEPAKEARPLSDFWEDVPPGEWHPYLVRFRQEQC